MKYTTEDIHNKFSEWCKVMNVPQAIPITPTLEKGTCHYPESLEFTEGAYCIPTGIMGYGIGRYANTDGAVTVILRTDKINTLYEMMDFAITSKRLSDK